MRLKIILTILSLLLVSTVIYAENGSLWSDEAGNIYQEQKESYEQGDVITIIIEESTDAVQSANTSTSQDSSTGAGPGLGILDFVKAFGLDYSDSEDAGGETEQNRQVSADITTQIVKSYDNGNFKIEGSKSITINDEKQTIKLSGIIRPDDISEENTISSKKLADASIDFEGKGIIEEKQKPGLLQRILNWIF